MLSDLRETVRMASQLSASHVRVFPGGLRGDVPPDSTHEPAVDQPVEDLIVDRLVRASAIAARHGLVLCVETHDSHPSGAAVARMLNRAEREGAAPEALGVVWDALHPWRVGEQPSRTAEILSPWLGAGRGWVQVKDVRDEHDLRPVLLGRGRVPIDKMRGALLAIGYHGVVSLEWERLWFPEISSLGHAIASAQTRLHAWMDAGSTCTAEPQVR
jgi:sugar phosphate isomerase/epimerase